MPTAAEVAGVEKMRAAALHRRRISHPCRTEGEPICATAATIISSSPSATWCSCVIRQPERRSRRRMVMRG
uniref:Uncharacterized protein n=1 Tax=Arundo donax TaxID=35708 RepID=A0A0A9GT54_ARUDO